MAQWYQYLAHAVLGAQYKCDGCGCLGAWSLWGDAMICYDCDKKWNDDLDECNRRQGFDKGSDVKTVQEAEKGAQNE